MKTNRPRGPAIGERYRCESALARQQLVVLVSPVTSGFAGQTHEVIEE
jgi:hypothetical protein